MAVEFYTVTLYLGARGDRFGIGICAEGHGLIPQMLLLVEEEKLVFGFSFEIAVFSLANRSIEFRAELPAAFCSFVHLPSKSLILVIHEIGVMALSHSNQCLWQYEQDIITDYQLINNKIIISFMDSPTVAIDLRTGAVIPDSP
jgi:hypothetical protein